MVGAPLVLAVLSFSIFAFGVRDRAVGLRQGEATVAESANLGFAVLCLMCCSGMLWHVVEPNLGDALPIGLILASFLSLGFLQASLGLPYGRNLVQLIAVLGVVAVTILAFATGYENYVVAVLACSVLAASSYATVSLKRAHAWFLTIGSAGFAAAFVYQAVSWERGMSLTVYPIGLLCLFVSASIYHARKYVSAVAGGESTEE